MFSHLVHMWTKNVHISWTDLFMSKKKNYCQKVNKPNKYMDLHVVLYVCAQRWNLDSTSYKEVEVSTTTSSRVLWSDICDGLDRTIPCGPYPVRLCHWFGLSYTRFCQTGAAAGVCILHRVHDRCTLQFLTLT